MPVFPGCHRSSSRFRLGRFSFRLHCSTQGGTVQRASRRVLHGVLTNPARKEKIVGAM